MGGHHKGPSAYEIEKARKRAEEKERLRLARERDAAEVAANAEANRGAISFGGEGSEDEGVLSMARKKRGSTLAGEGSQTFEKSASLGG